jgi:glycine oxidase
MSMQPIPKRDADVVISGAGVIGMAIALEMHGRGARVIVLERDVPLRQASFAAAGMLAVDDAHNPLELLPLSRRSIALYPAFLMHIESLSGMAIPFQTESTLQYFEDGSVLRLAERSIDPQQLATSLMAAVEASAIQVLPHTAVASVHETAGEIRLFTSNGVEFSAKHLVHANGAWLDAAPGISPRKGQMLRVKLALGEVRRSSEVYIVPRTIGPSAGTALIGATVEDAGFDTATHTEDLAELRRLAAKLLPILDDSNASPEVEAWAGLRPATPDHLPLLGVLREHPRQLVAAGHFRNGVLLAPATAEMIAALIEGRPGEIDLSPFRPERFT